jgi:hypothetical protein
VPTTDVLRRFCPFKGDPGPRKPDVYVDVMQSVASALQDTSACLTFDAKIIEQGPTAETGDVDILAFEDGPSLEERQHALEKGLRLLRSTIETLQQLDNSSDITSLPSDHKEELKISIVQLLPELSENAQKIRDIKAKKEYAKNTPYNRLLPLLPTIVR